tara:strand:- start:2486 stop:3283 length:798 start_codon:yes stop_codon:yes gene_type:complete
MNKMDERKDYWNKDYFEYWKNRVEEANSKSSNKSSIVNNDSKASSDANYIEAIELLDIQPNNHLLEMGCGFGRSIPYLYSKTINLFAADISEAMIQAAQELLNAEFPNVKYEITEAEKTPYKNDSLDNIICFASFDAMYQEKALIEFNRILKSSGKILITGKNDNYNDADTLAMTAEVNARKKGHPNHFTDVTLLLTNLDLYGYKIESQRFFNNRGDIAINKFTGIKPDHFYEFLIVLKKTHNSDHAKLFSFSKDYSKTFKRKQT